MILAVGLRLKALLVHERIFRENIFFRSIIQAQCTAGALLCCFCNFFPFVKTYETTTLANLYTQIDGLHTKKTNKGVHILTL